MSCARKHTLVTGCSSGIGRATVLRLAAAGQHVYAGVRKPEDGERLVQAATGGAVTPVMLDVTDTGHIAAAAAVIDGHTGPGGLDGLVNNAGYGLAYPAELVPLESFRRQLEVNVTGQLAVTQGRLSGFRGWQWPGGCGGHRSLRGGSGRRFGPRGCELRVRRRGRRWRR